MSTSRGWTVARVLCLFGRHAWQPGERRGGYAREVCRRCPKVGYWRWTA